MRLLTLVFSLWCTYMIVGIAIVAVCGAYYYFWMHLLPRWGNYTIVTQVLNVDDNGANTHRLVRVPNNEVAEWEATHDELGREIRKKAGESGGVLEVQTETAYPKN